MSLDLVLLHLKGAKRGIAISENLSRTTFQRLQIESRRKIAFHVEYRFYDGRIGKAKTRNDAHTLNTFITSSPRWLITLTAIRLEGGFGNGREVSLWRVDQASSLISALRVVLRAP